MKQTFFRAKAVDFTALIVVVLMGLVCPVAYGQDASKNDGAKSEPASTKTGDSSKADDKKGDEKDKAKRVESSAAKNGAAVAAANKFRQDCLCKSCAGKGVVDSTVKIRNRDAISLQKGQVRGGGSFSTSRQEVVTKRCGQCDGNCLNQTKVLKAAGERLAVAIAEVDIRESTWVEKHRGQIKEYVNEVANKGFRRLSQRLNEAAESIFADNELPKVGKPIVLVGRLADDERDDNGHRVAMNFSGDRRIVMDGPIIFDAGMNDNVLVVGLYRSGAGTSTIELEKGIVMTARDDESLDVEGADVEQSQPSGPRGRRNK